MSSTTKVIDQEFLQYFVRLNEPQKKSLLTMIKTFLKTNTQVSPTTSIDQYNKELDEAMARIKKGSYTTINALEKEMQEW